MSKKRAASFSDELAKKFPFIKKSKLNNGNVHCVTCNSEFSVSAGAKYEIERHITREKHKKALLSLAGSSKSNLTSFFRSAEFGEAEKKLAVSEATLCFHTVMHNQSFRSMDCTSKLLQKFFEKKFACARTKSEAIIKNVIAPFIMSLVQDELKQVSFVTSYCDASNHKDVKMFPTLVRYFSETYGVQIKVLDIVSLPSETADTVSNSITIVWDKNNITEKVVGFCADNANVNFGGVKRKSLNNIFAKLQNHLNRKLIGIGCAAHILNNAMQTAADMLPIDLEGILNKIYSYFFIYTVRVESLKQFCDESGIQYRKILSVSKTRWLALMPCIERVLQLYQPLKSYFLSIEKCPIVVKKFFESETSEMWLYFLHTQASIFHNSIKKIEGNKNSIMEVSLEIDMLINKFKDRLEAMFVPVCIRAMLTKLEENGDINRKWFETHVKSFYMNCIDYLELWSEQFEETKDFEWAMLHKEVNYDIIFKTFKKIEKMQHNLHFNENELFDEVCCLKRYVTKEKICAWKNECIDIDQRWVEIFSHFRENEIPYKALKKIIEYILCLPGTNGATERIFSIINNMWTTEKSHLKLETLQAMVQVKVNYVNSCDEFAESIKSNNELLKKVHNVQKYQKNDD